jgi:prolipoprotein diacylglyceryltransferase
VGEFLDGNGQGLPSSLPWATAYTSPLAATPDFGVPRHPAQLYDGLVALALFALLWLVPRSFPAGSRTAAFIMSYGLARVALGAVRLDPAFLFGLQIEQILAIGAVVWGMVFGLAPLAQRAGGHLRRLVPGDAGGAQPENARKEDSLAA